MFIIDTKITSFQRQLNLYGFRRILKGEDQGAYIHPLFQRGRPDLIHEIKRISSKPGDYGHIDTSYDSWPHTTKSATLKPNIKVTNDDDNSSAAQSKSIARMVYDVEARSRATQDTRYQNPSSIVPFKDIQPASNVIFSLNNGSNSLYHNKMSKLSINIGYDKYLSTTKIQTPEISSTNSGTPTSSTAAAVAAQSSFTHTSSSNITSNLQGNHSSTNKYMETRHSTLRHRGSEFSNETISNESSRNESQYDSMDISNNQLFKKPRNHDDIYPITNSNFYNYQNANMKSQNDNVMSCPNVDDDSDLNGLLLESFYDEDFSDLSMVLSEPTELKTDDVLGENANYGVTNNIKRSFSYDEFDNYRLNEFSSFVDFDDL